MEGDYDIAEFAECPWDWEMEDIENYIKALHYDEIVEALDNSQNAYGQHERWSDDQKAEVFKTAVKIIEKCGAMLRML